MVNQINLHNMNKEELVKKIMEKKEFSKLCVEDVLLAISVFERKNYPDYKNVKIIRDLLRKVFSSVINSRIFSFGERNFEDILKKHKSTKERFDYYEEVYSRILNGLDKNKKISVIDLGAGVNGFSFNYFKRIKYNICYVGIESVGQFVDMMNNYFKKQKLCARAVHLSLFNTEKVVDIIKENHNLRVVFLMKVIDSLEIFERDYSKKLLLSIKEVLNSEDRIVLSFATRSLIKKTKFKVKRYWIYNFILENFKLIDDFEIGGERYLVFGLD